MLRFTVNLNMLFTERPFLDRFGAARAARFTCVEFHCPYPYDYDPLQVAARLNEHGLALALFNLPVPDWLEGGRGLASNPAQRCEFRRGVRQALEWATRLNCRQINCPAGYRDPSLPLEAQHGVMVENLREAAAALEAYGITLLLEPLNPITHPDYLLTSTAAAAALITEVGAPNLKIQYDVYQMQRSEGDLAYTLETYLPQIAHIQIADSPFRHEPGTGEINFDFVLRHIERLGYRGWVALEYVPQGQTETSFGWMAEYGYRFSR